MNKLSKILLFAAATLFLAGLIICFAAVHISVQWAVALPLGAVMFGLFLIVRTFEKEMAGFDRDEARKPAGSLPEKSAAHHGKPPRKLEEVEHGTLYAHR